MLQYSCITVKFNQAVSMGNMIEINKIKKHTMNGLDKYTKLYCKNTEEIEHEKEHNSSQIITQFN